MVHRTKPLPAGSGLVNDDPQKADACEALFRKAIAGKESLFTSDMVITEIIWVLMAMIPTAKKSHGFFSRTENPQRQATHLLCAAISPVMHRQWALLWSERC